MDRPWIGLTFGGLGLARPETFESITDGFLRLRQDTGLDSVEIWMAPEHRPRAGVYWPEDYTPQRRERMARFLEHFDCCGVHLPFLFNNYVAPNPTIARAAMAQLELGLEIAGELGCRYAVVHAEWDNRGFVGEDGNFRRYVRAFRRLAALADRNGMRLCAETCFFLGRADRAVRMVRQVDHPGFAIALDAGKAMRNNDFSNQAVHDLIREIPQAIGSTHLYDYPSPTDTARVLPGCGMVDVPGFVRRLCRGGYRGVFNLETSGDYAAQKRAVLTLKEYVRRAASD